MSKVVMTFSGKNLVFVRSALDDAISNVHNEIATCPDVFSYEYADHLDELEETKKVYERLAARIDRRLKEET